MNDTKQKTWIAFGIHCFAWLVALSIYKKEFSVGQLAYVTGFLSFSIASFLLLYYDKVKPLSYGLGIFHILGSAGYCFSIGSEILYKSLRDSWVGVVAHRNDTEFEIFLQHFGGGFIGLIVSLVLNLAFIIGMYLLIKEMNEYSWLVKSHPYVPTNKSGDHQPQTVSVNTIRATTEETPQQDAQSSSTPQDNRTSTPNLDDLLFKSIARSCSEENQSTLKRAFIFIKNGERGRADEYLEKVLDKDPECSEAYLGKVLLQAEVRTLVELNQSNIDYCEWNQFQNAKVFANDSSLKLIEILNHRE